MSLKPLADYLSVLGLDDVPHTGSTFFSHVFGVHRMLRGAGFDEEVCAAGVFHSIYGTETTEGFRLPLASRGDVGALVGPRAERLAYLNCAMDRASFDRAVLAGAAPHVLFDRLAACEVALTPRVFADLAAVHLFDWLEQAPRSHRGFDYRRAAYRRMADLAGRGAVTAYDAVFRRGRAAEAAPSRSEGLTPEAL